MKKLTDIFKNAFVGKDTSEPHPLKLPLYPSELTAENISAIFFDCFDFKSFKIFAGGNRNIPVSVFFFDGLIDTTVVSEELIEPLSRSELFSDIDPSGAADIASHGGVYYLPFKESYNLDSVADDISNGFCCLFFETSGVVLSFDIKSKNSRAVSNPTEEKVVKGAKDAFVETLNINLSLIRRKLHTPKLKTIPSVVGRQSRTRVCILYLDGIADPETVREAKKRIDSIDIDGLVSSANLEEYIVDFPNSSFPQLITTERSDKFCMNLLEGRVGIIADGLPIGYLAPGTFAQFIKVPEDNASHFIVSSALTLLRYLSLTITLLLPAFYVAVATFHHEMIPTKLMLSIIASKQYVPFSTAAEVLGMLLAFELLQEAGLRLPNSVGQTISIIGALIVGQSAVEAKVISPVVVIVIAVAGVTGYTIPNQDLASALRITRFLLVISALISGMYGLAVGASIFLYRLCTLESFGVAYMTPFASAHGGKISKAITRWPLRLSKHREKALNTPNKRNQK